MTTTTGDGDFMTPANWNDGVPDAAKAAVVAHDMTAGDATAIAAASLVFSTGTLITDGTVTVDVGGDITLGNYLVANIKRNSGDLTITHGGVIKTTGQDGFITSTASAAGTITINGDVLGDNAAQASIKASVGTTTILNGDTTLNAGCGEVFHVGNAPGALVVNGNITGGPGQIALIGTGSFTHNGNTTTSAGNVGALLYETNTGGVIITNGTITSGDTGAAVIFKISAGAGSVTHTGNISIGTGKIIQAASTSNTTWTINGTMTTTGANSVAIENTAAGIPTITTTGLISVAGAGAKVFNLTSGVPVLHTNGGFAWASGASIGTLPSTVAGRIPPVSAVDSTQSDFGLNAGMDPTQDIAALEAAANAAGQATKYAADQAIVSGKAAYIYPNASILGLNNGTLRASNIGTLAGTDNLTAGRLGVGFTVDNIVGSGIVTTPNNANQCTGTLTLVNEYGAAEGADITVTFQAMPPKVGSGYGFDNTQTTSTTNASGVITRLFPAGAVWYRWKRGTGPWVNFQTALIPNTSFDIPNNVGTP
jgi:hypothetical protein